MPNSPISATRVSRLLVAAAILLGSALFLPHAFAAKSEAKPAGRRATYKLRPMDLVKVQVFQEPDLDRELRVSQDNTIVVPLIGVVDVKDRTVRDAEILITELYKNGYLINPQINIEMQKPLIEYQAQR